ncbi:hypothetical protein [Micromonospora sp. DT227]|uniref:hypothetical protein n=1 Tax=Micromonospora sp. DT227 TaxID=3393433 RepID=UPI003CF01338
MTKPTLVTYFNGKPFILTPSDQDLACEVARRYGKARSFAEHGTNAVLVYALGERFGCDAWTAQGLARWIAPDGRIVDTSDARVARVLTERQVFLWHVARSRALEPLASVAADFVTAISADERKTLMPEWLQSLAAGMKRLTATLGGNSTYNRRNECRKCGAHIADPHMPGCPNDIEGGDVLAIDGPR